ncbi:uncharacterized protein LOC115245237 [Formica exsecta]|uniref:uncharacterized protein LOC115245237 n=1 Tax=Formica exsecta TaxID=72781 RepID=UPI001144229D|nr:uncharacterized protein LOC115245237 [Formica exsecta]
MQQSEEFLDENNLQRQKTKDELKAMSLSIDDIRTSWRPSSDINYVELNNKLKSILEIIQDQCQEIKELRCVAKVSVEDVVHVFKNFATHFTTNDLSYSSKVWIDMSIELNGKWTAHDVYIAVREDRRGIVTKARDELGIVVSNSTSKGVRDTEYIDNSNSVNDSAISDGTDGTDSADFNNNTCLAPLLEFDLILAEEEWDAMKPNATVQYGRRKKYILTKGVWTDIISIALWQQHISLCLCIQESECTFDSG